MLSNKKGISAIVATLLIILLAIIAFSIVSVVVKNTVTKGAENIELGIMCGEVEIHATKIVEEFGDSFEITFSRSASGEDLDGLRVILNNAEGDESVSNEVLKSPIPPLEKWKESINFDGIIFDVASVTVVPYFNTEAGKPSYCQNSWTDELTVVPFLPTTPA